MHVPLCADLETLLLPSCPFLLSFGVSSIWLIQNVIHPACEPLLTLAGINVLSEVPVNYSTTGVFVLIDDVPVNILVRLFEQKLKKTYCA